MNLYQRLFFSLICFSCITFSQAQDTEASKRSLADVYLLNGFYVTRDMDRNLQDFRKLAPGSSILNNNFSDYTINGNGYGGNAGAVFSMLMGINLNKNPNRQFRVGITYMGQNGFSYNLYRETRKRFDTIPTPQGNIYYDSTERSSVHMEYLSEQLRLDLSLIFRTDPRARWSIYSGIGISGGMSLNSRVRIQRQTSEQVEASGPFYYRNYLAYYPRVNESENFMLKTNYGASAYIPLGVDFRVGRKRAFWKRLHLFTELRPGINVMVIPDLETSTTGYMHNSFGLRVSLD